MNGLSAKIRAALRCARRGWPVFPVHSVVEQICTCNKPDCRSAGKHPRTARGLKDATTDGKQIREWWGKWPNANVAVPTGSVSGVCVLDVDRRSGGKESLQQLLKENEIPSTPTVKTGDGWHYYFARPEITTRSRKSVLPGIEFKADGTYVIVPPSFHKSGATYLWLSGKTPEKVGLAPLPPWLEKIVQNGDRSAETSRTIVTGEVIPQGSRHDRLVRIAGALRRQGALPDEIVIALSTINRNRCDPPLSEDEVIRIAQSSEAWKPVARNSSQYAQTADGIFWNRVTPRDGLVPVRLTNFAAAIVAETAEDDGVEVRRSYQIEAELHGKKRLFTVPAPQFAGMNWATENLGAKAIVAPGMGLRDHARAAIQELSPEPEERIIFAHTGWRSHNEEWLFLHGDGAISRGGLVQNVCVQLPNSLSPFSLPVPPAGNELRQAVRASLKLLDLAPRSVVFPLYDALWASLIGRCDYSIFLAGQTGVGKTELAALHQQHFGASFGARNLPGSWSSTANANESLAFTAKDSLLVLDDFAPTGTRSDLARYHKDADRILRAQGNNSGRVRMRPDATLRASKMPRGLILSTGEDIPRGQSLRVRTFVVDISPDDLNWDLLGECQDDAATGIYAQAMSAYLRWFAGRYEKRRRELPKLLELWRGRATESTHHRRTPEILAHLQVGFNRFLDFAQSIDAITEEQALKLKESSWKALGQAATAQNRHQKAEDPVVRFPQLIQSLIASGRAYLEDLETENSQNPKGDRVGWIEGDVVLLNPDAAFAGAQKLSQEQGEFLTISQKTLWARMRERGLLLGSDADRNLKRETIRGVRHRVVRIPGRLLSLASGDRDNRD